MGPAPICHSPTPVDDVAALAAVLEGAGYKNVEIEREDDRSFRVFSGTVGSDVEDAAREALRESIGEPVLTVNSAIDEAKALIGQTALLEFKERTCEDLLCAQFTDADLGLSGDDLERAEAAADPVGVGWVVNLQFDGRGSDIFSDLTRRIAGVETKRIAVFMDDEELIAPVARAWIRDGSTQVSGDFTRERARSLAIQLESGRLQVPLKLIQESDVEALYGEESLRNSLRAGLVGLGLVLLFMVVYYRMAGVVAACALLFYAVTVLAVFKLIPITLELAHIGGFILSIGMAVDANILIFERMKEEVRIGRTLASSMEVGFGRAWPAIRDSNSSTMITCLVLLWFGDRLGGGLVTGVAISLFIGVAASMFTGSGGEPQPAAVDGIRGAGAPDRAVHAGKGGWRDGPSGLGACGRRRPLVLDIVGKRGWYFLFSALIIIPGILSMLLPPGWVTLNSGLRPGIDFTSGAVFNVTFVDEVNQQDIQDRMDALGHPEALVQRVGVNNYFIRTEVLEEAVGDGLSEREVIERDLADTLGLDRDLVEFESVSPIVASETVNIAFYALAAASVVHPAVRLVRVPTGAQGLPLRSQRRAGAGPRRADRAGGVFYPGPGHRVRGELDVHRGAADRCRVQRERHYRGVRPHQGETYRGTPTGTWGNLVNLSIMETMGRSLNTSVTTLIVLIAMLLIGGPSIRELLLVLAIGAGGRDVQQHLHRQPVPGDVGPGRNLPLREDAPHGRDRGIDATAPDRQVGAQVVRSAPQV